MIFDRFTEPVSPEMNRVLLVPESTLAATETLGSLGSNFTSESAPTTRKSLWSTLPPPASVLAALLKTVLLFSDVPA